MERILCYDKFGHISHVEEREQVEETSTLIDDMDAFIESLTIPEGDAGANGSLPRCQTMQQCKGD